ncbi:MAG: serine O-acetyltransferase, partial [Dehalococcoidia bacterium]|nr:serine O-acetyltransferase [Dehalococcoidia bacterium]
QTVFARDPAARNTLEVVLVYPGLHALWYHRVSHFLWTHRLKLPARMLSNYARTTTGIEIHPGARIGRRFFIDHGAGVVIGETSEIGDDVLIYQGVVLGGTTLEKKKRHPTIGNNVVIGAAAVVLGPIIVGADARIGANSVVVKSVPPGATVVGVPGRIVVEAHLHTQDLQHGQLPDPISEAIRLLADEERKLDQRIRALESSSGLPLTVGDCETRLQQIERLLAEKGKNKDQV